MEVGAVIGYLVAFLLGLLLGRVWGGAAARKGGNMISTRRASTPRPLASAPSRPGAPPDAAFEAEVRRLVAAGNIINAIKLYRERTGCGLKEAKDAVERICGR